MPTRSRSHWKPDKRGYFNRQIGWKRSRSGNIVQHKFILGSDRKKAEKRERKLRELWDNFEMSSDVERPLWSDGLMDIARRIAKGIPHIPVPRGNNERQVTYAGRIQRMQAKYPVILFVPEDQYAYEIGQAALEQFEQIPSPLETSPEFLGNIDSKDFKVWVDAHVTLPP